MAAGAAMGRRPAPLIAVITALYLVPIVSAFTFWPQPVLLICVPLALTPWLVPGLAPEHPLARAAPA